MNEKTQVKLSIPLIDEIELTRIDNYYNEIVSEYTKAFVKEREQIITQRLMSNLQQENINLKETMQQLEKWLELNWKESQDIWFIKIINKIKELKGEQKNE